jgi:hypothetical protein
MPVLESSLDVRSAAFARNREDMLDLLQTVDELLQEASEGGGPELLTS